MTAVSPATHGVAGVRERSPHPYHQAIIDAYQAVGRPKFHQVSPVQARELLRSAVAAAPKPADLPVLHSVEHVTIHGRRGPILLRVYQPAGETAGTCVFFHGGGWVIGDLDQCDSTCRRLAGGAKCRVVGVDYRLAPEHPFPEPLDDCWEALGWVSATYPGGVIVGGESAGANLAAACAIRVRDGAGVRLAGQLLVCPVTAVREQGLVDFQCRHAVVLGPILSAPGGSQPAAGVPAACRRNCRPGHGILAGGRSGSVARRWLVVCEAVGGRGRFGDFAVRRGHGPWLSLCRGGRARRTRGSGRCGPVDRDSAERGIPGTGKCVRPEGMGALAGCTYTS